ncbi:hypothetical protein AZI98_07560 [Aeribacillus pallidus]|uniref:Uncharacterized protein n=1 Tax=Aeribacillus pallidus TaxID=33936 RepID=A0A165Y2G7_9BACI|nr:hypothetical protein AZI98_07560 [Aeribacillus pallidus]
MSFFIGMDETSFAISVTFFSWLTPPEKQGTAIIPCRKTAFVKRFSWKGIFLGAVKRLNENFKCDAICLGAGRRAKNTKIIGTSFIKKAVPFRKGTVFEKRLGKEP